MLSEGSPAPDFDLPATIGQPFRLSQHRGKPVVLFFYPRDFTPGCKAEVCAFRDDYESFLTLGAVVAGVSTDDEAQHQRFSTTHHLPYPLLADDGGRVRRLYAVPRLFGLLPMASRVTYVIDAAGIIRHVFSSNRNSVEHVSRALEALGRL
jgi:thioredoxin-dependent peroxiredoxin